MMIPEPIDEKLGQIRYCTENTWYFSAMCEALDLADLLRVMNEDLLEENRRRELEHAT